MRERSDLAGVELYVNGKLIRKIVVDQIPGRGGVTHSRHLEQQQAALNLIAAVNEHCGKPTKTWDKTPA